MDYQGEFNGKRVLITGAAGVHGGWIAAAFSREGARLCLSDLRADRLPELPGTELRHATDLTDSGSIRELALLVSGEWGAPDIVINNAGIYPRSGPLIDLAEAEFDRIMSVNVRAPFLVTQAMARLMVEQDVPGVFVNIGSGAARQMPFGAVPYCVSKTALERLSKGQALELARHNIRVNVVEPGFAAGSDFSPLPQEHIERMTARIPLGRTSGPHDTSRMVLFMCSEATSFVTGTVVAVDGGNSIGTYQPTGSK